MRETSMEDGDEDVLSAALWDKAVAWYENENGKGAFGEQELISWANQPRSVRTADIDGDGDLDVLSASIGRQSHRLV